MPIVKYKMPLIIPSKRASIDSGMTKPPFGFHIFSSAQVSSPYTRERAGLSRFSFCHNLPVKNASQHAVLMIWSGKLIKFLITSALWSITAKNRDVSTGPLARPFTRSLAPLTRSLAPDCSLRSRPLLRSLVRSLAHFAHSLARWTVND